MKFTNQYKTVWRKAVAVVVMTVVDAKSPPTTTTGQEQIYMLMQRRHPAKTVKFPLHCE